ncbi:MAG: dihydroorotate dehydrogenase electron transfer subunit [Desulfonauticus sp.]|nr:dihydroorotate dehydrogenase electron transfer subunit [Desulfonauticus sp.]
MFNKTLRVIDVQRIDNAPLAHLFLETLSLDFKPGQFVMLRPCQWEYDPFWPRPFSICTQDEHNMHIFLQIVGRGTQKLAYLQPGDEVDCWGPLGNGFEFAVDEDLLVLAGGMGLAPFIALSRKHPNPQKIRLVFGHRLDLDCYPWHLIPAEVEKVALQQETQTALKDFEKRLQEEIFSHSGKVFACGPRPFLQVVYKYARQAKADAYISLENKMACGIGACLGCVTKTKQGYKQTCVHGPVFSVHDLEDF